MDIERSIEFSLLKELEKKDLIDLILPTQEVLKHIREIKCNELQYSKVKNGQSIKVESSYKGFKSEVWASYKENPIAIGIIDGEVFSPKRIKRKTFEILNTWKHGVESTYSSSEIE